MDEMAKHVHRPRVRENARTMSRGKRTGKGKERWSERGDRGEARNAQYNMERNG